jgi:DNA-binding transcriptional LysR family regulator
MDLDPVKLRTLVELRAAGSMTAAAAALGDTTGAVSQQMAVLQRSVKTELFTQVGRRVQLTAAGRGHGCGLTSLCWGSGWLRGRGAR